MKSKTIEVMKAIGITGIVLLHAIFIQYNYDTTLSNILRLVAIKVLLLLSGFVVYGKITKTGWVLEKIVRRIPMLLIFLTIYWGFATMVAGFDGGSKISVGLPTFYASMFVLGFTGLIIWYIWVLVLCYIVLWVFEKYIANKLPSVPYLLKLTGLIILLALIPMEIFGLRYLRWYGLFMIVGYGLRYAVENYKPFLKYASKLVYSSLVLFPVSILLLGQIIDLGTKWVTGGGENVLRLVNAESWLIPFSYMFVTLTGIAFAYCISKMIGKLKWNRPILLIGESTIGILLLHKMFLELKLFDNYWIAFVLAVIVSLAIYLPLKRINILNYLLFGGTDIPIKISNRLGGWYGKMQEKGQSVQEMEKET